MPKAYFICDRCKTRKSYWVADRTDVASCTKCGTPIQIGKIHFGASWDESSNRTRQTTRTVPKAIDSKSSSTYTTRQPNWATSSTWFELVNNVDRRLQATRTASPHTLIAAACITTYDDEHEAITAAVSRYGANRSVTKELVRDESLRPYLNPGTSVLAALTGFELDADEEDQVLYLLSLCDEGTDVDDLELSQAIDGSFDKLGDDAFYGSYASRFIGSAFLSQHDALDELLEHLPAVAPYVASEEDLQRATTVAAAYLIRSLDSTGLPFSSFDDILDVDSGWCQWVPGALDPSNPYPTEELLGVVTGLGLDSAEINDPVFELTGTEEWVEQTRAMANMVAPHLKKLQVPYLFQCDDVEMVLCEHDGLVTAWVGLNDTGLVLSFDTTEFTIFAMPDPSISFAAGCAIAGYVDATSQLTRRTKTAPTRRNASTSTRLRRTFASEEFDEQVEAVARGEQRPPKPHFVAAHIRHLRDKRPNPEHVNAAPEILRRRMGPNDTWVIGHERGTNNSSEVLDRVRTHSALADALGLLRRLI